MSKINYIAPASLTALTGAAAFISPALAMGFAVASLLSLIPLAKDKKDKIAAIENTMLLEDSRFPKVLCTGRGQIISYNISGGEFFGKEGEVFAKIASELCPADSATKEGFAKLSQSLSLGLDTSAALALGTKGDSRFFVEIRKIKGRPLWLATAKDITAKTQINTFLQKERRELSAFLDNIPIGLFATDAKGNILVAGGTFCKWLDISSTMIVGLNIADFIVGNNKPDPLTDWQGDVTFKTAKGSFFKAHFRQFLSIEDGASIIRAAVIRNVTSARELEGELEQTKRQVALLFGDTPFGIALADKDGTISEINPALVKMLGRQKSDIIGATIFKTLGEVGCFELQDKMTKVLQGTVAGARCEVKVEGDSPSSDRIFAIFIRPMKSLAPDPDSEPGTEYISGLIFHFFDTTEWKNLELQFEQAQKMQAMGQLAGGIAHDFNNILTGILGFCDFLLARHNVGDPSFTDIMQIQQNAARAANLVRQLLAFSRKQSLTPKIIDTSEAFADIVDMVRQLIGARFEVKVDYARDLGYIRIDKGQFEQVFMNLAVNACHAMGDKGTITINIAPCTFTEPQQNDSEVIPAGDFVMFEFSDTGCGIPKENLKRIFEPFFSTKADKGEGTGLGLATVYGIIRQTDGFISVESKIGVGTTFKVLLPRFQKPKDEPAPKPAEAPKQVTISANMPPVNSGKDLKGTRILLAEDESAVRLFAARALKNKGFAVTACDCGESALKAAREDRHFDLLLTDMTMPGMDGATLAKEVKALIPPIKIIIMSGFSEDIAKGALADNEEIDFLGKPFNLDQIVKKVKEVLS